MTEKTTHRIRAHRGDARERLDLALVRHLEEIPGLSRTRIQEWIADGMVRVNGAPARRASERLAAGDEVEIDLPPPPPRPEMAAQEIPLSILYKDEHLVAVDKPPGLVVHPTYGHHDGTLLNALLWHLRQDGKEPGTLGPVSRLDKWTSGVLVVARGGEAHAKLARALRSTISEKEYLAVVYGRTGVDRGRIDLWV
ncbi:MAG TPA: RluA family pseudouridine synthase, partial [Thermoanaerobaculia bacterium]|nr:RluA family pseudouridine synthase [Thermoanaerobaculia bacterium]